VTGSNRLIDPVAERVVLGAALLDSRLWETYILAGLTADHFAGDLSSHGYAAACRLIARGQAVDITSLYGEMRHALKSTDPESIIRWAEDLPSDAVTSVVGPQTCKRLIALAQSRNVQAECATTARRLAAGEVHPDALATELDRLDSVLLAHREQQAGRSLGIPQELLGDMLLSAEERMRRPAGSIPWIPSGVADLDAVTGGARRKKVVLVAGRPSMGKSTLAMNWACAAARADHPGLVCTLEDDAPTWTARAVAHLGQVPLDVTLGKASPYGDQYEGMFKGGDVYRKLPLRVWDGSNATPEQLRAQIRIAQRELGEVRWVVVDYIGLMMPPGGKRLTSREQEVARTSAALVAIAKDLDVAMIVAAQLNRDADKRSSRVPGLSDLRESGSLEQDAYQVILLHRPSFYEPGKRDGEIDLIVAKNKDGDRKTVAASWSGARMTVADLIESKTGGY
jgi:replicative DNA helicase